jgi:hypothetical protein
MEQEVLAILAMVVFGVFVFAAVFRSQEKLDDPNNETFIYIYQIKEVWKLLPEADYDPVVWRQSGEIHSHSEFTMSREDALDYVLKTMRRAGIDAVSVLTNTEDEFTVRRSVQNARGRQEGKRVGGFTLKMNLNSSHLG